MTLPGRVLVAGVAVLLAAALPARAEPAPGRALAFSLQTSPDIFPWWETICRPGDWLSGRDAAAFQNRCGGRIVIFPSVATAEATVPAIAGSLSGIGYDPEHWAQTPDAEKADLAAAARRFRTLADRYGLEAHIGPDRTFAVSDGVRMASFADVMALQLQNFTNDLAAIHQFADPLIASLRAANPSIRIEIQLRTDLSVTDLVTIARALDVDAVTVLYQSSTVEAVKGFEAALRGATPTAVWLLPSSAHLPGAAGAIWTTTLTVANPGTADATVTLKFLGHDADGRPGIERSFPLGAGTSATFPDVLAGVFGLESAWGALRIGSDSPSLVAVGETSTPGGGGTFGQCVPAVGAAEWITGAAPASILAIREDALFRTNLVLANATEAPLEVAVTLVSDSGASLATGSYALPPLGMTQVTRVVRALGVTADIRGARLVLGTGTPGGAFAAYASVIDAVTSDPRTLLPR